MSHKFRFSEKCIDRLKEYCGIPGKDEKVAKPRRVKESELQKAAQPAEPVAPAPVPTVEIPKVDGIVARTDVGRVRSSNQDAVIVAPGLAGVADGMGGHQGGEVASAAARDLLIEFLGDQEMSEGVLKTAVENVNQRIFVQQAEDEKLSGMGTTLTALWFDEKSIIMAHVGDSRAYRLRDGELKQMTHDHSLVEELVRQGMLTPEQAACHPMRNVITRAVGTEADIEVDLSTEERHPGDLWLICSDGLHGMVSDERMKAILTGNEPEKAADLLLEAALEAGGRDNISLVIFLDGEADK